MIAGSKASAESGRLRVRAANPSAVTVMLRVQSRHVVWGLLLVREAGFERRADPS